MTSRARPPSERLNREIFVLAVPSILSTITVPLVGIADTALVGRLGPIAYIGAVSIGAVLFDTLFWAFGFLRMGTTALVAQAYGAGDDRRAGETLLQSSALALAAGLLMILFREPIATAGLALAGGTDEVQRWAYAYFTVRIFSAPAVLLTYGLNGFFRGMKDAVTPLVLTVLIHGTNIAGDVVLIYGKLGMPALGVVGAAWASLAAALVGVVAAVAIIVVRYRFAVAPALAGLLHADGMFRPRRLRRLATTHTNLFFRTLLLLAAYFTMVGVASRLGEVALAANAVVLQIWHLASHSVDGVAFASETLVGNAIGANAATLTRRYAWRSLFWGTVFAALFSVIYLFSMRSIAGMFTENAEVVAAVAAITVLTAAAMPINAVAFIFDGIFIGANDMVYLFRQMAVSFFLVFVPAVVLLVGIAGGGLVGLWGAMALFMVARAVTLTWKFARPGWVEQRIVDAEAG